MEFSPFNKVVRYCVLGIDLEEKNRPEEALRQFLQGWNEATDDFEKFLSAYFVARQQKDVPDNLKWLGTALEFALKTKSIAAKSALPSLHARIAECFESMGDRQNAKKHHELERLLKGSLSDKGPFYHGTRAALQTGELLRAGINSNYQAGLAMNHIYFTALVNGAGLAAALANGDGPEHVYIVEPTGEFEDDPNVTDKKFPGNPTRSYRSRDALKIVGEVTNWEKPAPEALALFRAKLAAGKGAIIN